MQPSEQWATRGIVKRSMVDTSFSDLLYYITLISMNILKST